MLLSIIIPAYNVEKYIENCIETIENQDLDKNQYEIIIINDGSKDETENICKNLMEKYSNIVLKTVENGGQSKARNLGISLAKGKFLEFIDSDDYIAHNMLSKIAKLADEDIELICFQNKRVTKLDEKDSYVLDGEIRSYETGKDCFVKEAIDNGPWWYWVRKSVLDNNNLKFIEDRLLEDGMFTCKLFSVVKNVLYTPYDIYRYVDRAGSTCKKYDKAHQKKMISDFIYAIEYFDNLIKINKENSSNEYIEALTQRMYSYIFFLQARLLRLGDKEYAKEKLEYLNKNKLYPYRWKSYAGFKYKVLNLLFKNKTIFLNMCKIKGLLNKGE